jgi:hypothetical protein
MRPWTTITETLERALKNEKKRDDETHDLARERDERATGQAEHPGDEGTHSRQHSGQPTRTGSARLGNDDVMLGAHIKGADTDRDGDAREQHAAHQRQSRQTRPQRTASSAQQERQHRDQDGTADQTLPQNQAGRRVQDH